jgi:hypothetical protein
MPFLLPGRAKVYAHCTSFCLACQSQRGYMQQSTPYTQLTQELPSFLPQETDTATPRTPIPIYYFHDGRTPFCYNPACFCQRGKRAGALFYRQIAQGKLQLVQLVQANTQRPVDLLPTVPEECQLYGHSWEVTAHQHVKKCSLCHMRGYCPGCTPEAPAGAQPFSCTYHAGRTGQ